MKAFDPIRTPLFVAPLLLASVGMAQDDCGVQRVGPATGTPPTDFAVSIATNGSQWLIGDGGARTWCPGDPFRCAAGAVHSYEAFDGILEHVQTIVPPDIAFADNFGDAIAIDGGRMLVGIPGRDWPDTRLVGGAIVYEYVDGWWVEVDRLRPPPDFHPDIEFSGFGRHIALDGDLALLRPSRADAGVIMVFHRTPDGWAFRESLEAPDGVPDEAVFGEYPALSEGWLMVTAREDSTAADRAGSVYVYRRHADDSLEFAQKLYAPEPQELGRYGFGLAHQGETLVVGAFLMERPFVGQGLVFVYGLENDRWVLRQEIALSDARRNDGFGANVHLDGDLLLVEARGRPHAASSSMVFRFERDADGRWREIGPLVPNAPVWARSYGRAMASRGGASGEALIGAHDDVTLPSDFFGAAYFFDLACDPCPPDLDADGTLTIFDFLIFLNLFQDGDAQADFDGDGELTIFDFLAFQTAFDAGCE